MEIKRDKYLNKLIQKQNNHLIKVITGLRRSGKTYLLFNIFKNYLLKNGFPKDQIIEMSFDSYRNKKYRNPDQFLEFIDKKIENGKPYILLLDEVQLLDEFEFVLNDLIRNENLDIYVTGSNAKFLSQDIITEFRGRGDPIHVNPLSFREFSSVYDGSNLEAWNEYIQYGGLPQVVLLQSPEEKANLLNNLLAETYLSDLYGRHSIRNKVLFENLFKLLASDIGSLTNPNRLAKTVSNLYGEKISYQTIKNNIDHIEDAFLISSVHRFDVKGKKYLNALKKYYFSDIGLRNALLNFRQLEETHILENIIYNELINLGYSVDVGIVESVEKDKNKKSIRKQYEIDFVCNKLSEKIYIQVALSTSNTEKLNQELNSFKRFNDSFRKILITKDTPASHYNTDGVFIINLFDFLLEPEKFLL